MKIKLMGFKELEDALRQLPRATAKTVVRNALKKAGQPILDAAQAKAPKLSGRLGRQLLMSGKVKGGNAGAQAFGAALRAGADQATARTAARDANRASGGVVEIFIGPNSQDGQGLLQEFGTVTNTPQPFMRPAWDANKDRALDIIKTEVGNEIAKAAARLAKKRAKAGV